MDRLAVVCDNRSPFPETTIVVQRMERFLIAHGNVWTKREVDREFIGRRKSIPRISGPQILDGCGYIDSSKASYMCSPLLRAHYLQVLPTRAQVKLAGKHDSYKPGKPLYRSLEEGESDQKAPYWPGSSRPPDATWWLFDIAQMQHERKGGLSRFIRMIAGW